MAVGAKQITLDVTQFISGMASSDYADDGGLGTSCSTINPFVTPGTIYPTASITDKSTNLNNNIIATSEDSQTTLPSNRILIDDHGSVYSAATSGTLTRQITDGSDTYAYGQTDLLPYNTSVYATSTTHLVQLNTSAWTRTEAYKNFSNTGAHPLLTYIGLLFAGDGNLLQTLDSAGTWTTQMTLTPGEQILSLAIDPYTGLMLISTQVSFNPTDTIQQKGVVYLHDGVAKDPRRRIITEEAIQAFYPCGGQVYVGMGVILGQWNGQGVTFLRRLTGASLTQNGLAYKHHFATWRHILLIIDGVRLMAYGEVVPGKKGFYNIAQVYSNQSPNVFTVGNIGGDIIGLSSSTKAYAVVNMAASTGGAANLVFNNIYFPRPVFIHRVRVISTGIDTNQSRDMVINVTDEKGSNQAYDVVNTSGSTAYVHTFDLGGFKLLNLGLNLSMTNWNAGIVRIIIYYDVAE